MKETTTKIPTTIPANLKNLHRQLEERFARVQSEENSETAKAKQTDEPAAFSAGR